MQKATLIDSTLRDGGYEVNFSFTPAEVATICQKLEEAGVRFIEIGRGVAMGAGGYRKDDSNADEEYMDAATSVLKKAKFGMFFFPGISTLDHIARAAKHKIGFIRVGTDVTEIHLSEPYIKKAKEYGIFVTANFMKSYALDPRDLAKQVQLSEKFGADVVYLVDSAGGMFPDDIARYYTAIRKISQIRLGFHGHDNLGFGVANSISAVELGFEFVDATLQGLGRSGGNACIEILVAAFEKKGYNTGVDFLKLLEIGETYIKPKMTRCGRDRLDVVAGFAKFHSLFTPLVLKYAEKYAVDPATLMIEVSKKDLVNVLESDLEEIAKGMCAYRRANI